MAEETRDDPGCDQPVGPDADLGTRIARLFDAVGLTEAEFEAFRRGTVLHRGDPGRRVDFGQ